MAVAQIGPAPVLAAAIVWLYWQGLAGLGTGLLVWSIFVGTMDNVLRPILMKKGADLPLLLILAGVIARSSRVWPRRDLVGPGVLAVAYRLVEAWIGEELGEPGPLTEEAFESRRREEVSHQHSRA